jgi:hypothetical protein
MAQKTLIAAITTLLACSAAQSHHSFAAFFDGDKTLKLVGTVVDFRFTNPHGTIGVEVVGADGKKQLWRAETNAPVVLMRRGWNRTIIKAGDKITIDGWPSRDGKPYMRLRQALNAEGKMIGRSAFGQADEN